MKLLLHACCAPCLIYPLGKLKEKGFNVSAFFYNPNIHPLGEYNNRKQAVLDLSKRSDLDVICPEYSPAEFFQAVYPALSEENGHNERCSICWSMRLKKTAQEAKEKGFTHFTTTLLVSPYQDQGLLQKIGSDVSKEEGVEFIYEDFRPGFRKAHDQAKKEGIYCQKYCGCLYSEIERNKRLEKH